MAYRHPRPVLRAGGQSAAATLTDGLVTLLASSFTALWVRLPRAEEFSHPGMRRTIRRTLRRSVAGPVAYGTGTLISLASAPIAFALHGFVPVFFAFSGRPAFWRSSKSEPDQTVCR
jgi:hypothetical protein